MIKIKYITNVRIPSERAQAYAIMKMCEQFGSAGAEVELIIPNRKHSEIKEDPFQFYGIATKFRIKRVKSIDLLGPFFAFGKLFYWIDIISFLLSIFLSNTVKREEVIYTRDFLVPIIFSRKRFICLELHDIPTSKFLFKFLVKKPKLFFVLNQNLKNILVELGISPTQIHIAPSGVDLQEFDINLSKEEARGKLSLPLDKKIQEKIVMYTGHLYGWKGADTLAEAARLVPEAHFVFVGGVEPELSRFRQNFGSLPNVTIRESAPRKEMPWYNKAADILVLPNSANSKISSFYTSPLKLFEYMASRKPIVASDLPSIREVLTDEINRENCVFAKPDQPESFAIAIKKIISDPELGDRISEKAFQEAQKYSWEARARKILDIIKHDILAK